jgi:hypothetical protein
MEELILYGIESYSVIIGNFMAYLFIIFVCQSLPLKLNNFTVLLHLENVVITKLVS